MRIPVRKEFIFNNITGAPYNSVEQFFRIKFEMYKTSHHFDGTYQNPQWLG
jgi:hypothetical protein